MGYVVYLVVCIGIGAGVIAALSIDRTPAPEDTDAVDPTDVSDIVPQDTTTDGGTTSPQGSYGIPFTVTTTGGQSLPLSQFQGKVLVIMFWGIRCPACELQTPVLREVHASYQGAGTVEFVSLEVQGATTSQLHQWEATNQVSWYSCADTGVQVASYYRIASIPTTIIFDGDGNEAQRFIGAQDASTLTSAINAAAS